MSEVNLISMNIAVDVEKGKFVSNYTYNRELINNKANISEFVNETIDLFDERVFSKE